MGDFSDIIKEISEKKGWALPNPKQMRYLDNRISFGMTVKDALKNAGYHPSNHDVSGKMDCYIQEYHQRIQDKIQSELGGITEIVPKDYILKKLKLMLENEADSRVVIQIIMTLNKMLGYDAPIRTENRNETVHTLVSFIEDGNNAPQLQGSANAPLLEQPIEEMQIKNLSETNTSDNDDSIFNP